MIKVAIIGLGGVGKVHAININRIPQCRVVAACRATKTRDWAQEHLGDVEIYEDIETLLKHSDAEAVVISSPLLQHARQTVQCIEAGKHVLCEKPLGRDGEECREVARYLAKHKKHNQVFLLGFMRRFDKAYAHAKRQIERGLIGEPFLMKSQLVDHCDFAPYLQNYKSAEYGDIFHDMSVHDIDVVRWFLQADIKQVHAIGTNYAYPQFETDTTVVTAQCENNKLALICAGRTAHHGHATQAEVHGTKGILRIGFTPAWTDVEILDASGQHQQCVHAFFDRFKDAFVAEAEHFLSCIANKREAAVGAEDGLYATRVADACALSLKENRIVHVREFDA